MRLSFLGSFGLPSYLSHTKVLKAETKPLGLGGLTHPPSAAHLFRDVKYPLLAIEAPNFTGSVYFPPSPTRRNNLYQQRLPYVSGNPYSELFGVCWGGGRCMHISWLLKEVPKSRHMTNSLVPAILTRLEEPLLISEWLLHCTIEFCQVFLN